jgi:hypothetical protein
MNAKTRLLGMGAALALLSCGNDGDGKGGKLPAPRPGAVSADLERYVRAICAKAIGCGYGEGEDVEACTASLLGNFCEPGHATVTLPGLDACLATFTCETFEGVPAAPSEACEGVSRSMLEAQGFEVAETGEACSAGLARGGPICANGDFCSAGEGEQCGTCTARKPEGAACASILECESFYCAEDGTCHTRLADGEPCEEDMQCRSFGCHEGTCGDGEYGGSCADSDDCYGGEFCLDGTCVPPRADGEACTSDEQCLDTCVDGKCGATAGCGAGEVGDACNGSEHCQEGLNCSLDTYRCVAAVAIGATCRASYGECVDGSYCEVEDFSSEEPTGTCTALKPDGTACDGSSECESGTCSEAGQCASPALCGGSERRRPHSMRTITSAARPATRAAKQRSTASSARPSMVSLVRYSPSLPQRR